MIAVLQRVYNATVYSDGVCTGSIGEGLYILLGVKNTDCHNDATALAEKISKKILIIIRKKSTRLNRPFLPDLLLWGCCASAVFTTAASFSLFIDQDPVLKFM